jgi:protein-ribulosamine 3-kinase
VTLPNGTFKRYFLKVSCTSNSPSAPIFDLHLQTATGNSSRALAEREFYSICAIDAVVPELVPKAVGWGQYQNHKSQDVYFFLDNFHDMVLLEEPPDPAHFMSQIAETHQKGTSPNGMFGFQVATVCGIMERTVTWEQSWAKSFTHQLKDVIKYDNETNGPWPEYDAACKQFIDVVTVLFDAGCTYAHNKMEFGTWRCSWAMYFRGQKYIRLYKSYNQASEPENE